MMSLPSFPRSFGWELLQGDTDKKFVVDPLTENGLYALPLPAGTYHVTKLRYEDRNGVWEGSAPASFSVKDGWTYVGTWELTYGGLGSAVPITAATRDDLKDERAEFEIRYRISGHPVKVGLLQSAPTGHLSLLRPRSEQ
jgi:hypothetical protein